MTTPKPIRVICARHTEDRAVRVKHEHVEQGVGRVLVRTYQRDDIATLSATHFCVYFATNMKP